MQCPHKNYVWPPPSYKQWLAHLYHFNGFTIISEFIIVPSMQIWRPHIYVSFFKEGEYLTQVKVKTGSCVFVCIFSKIVYLYRQQRFRQHTQEDSHKLLRYLLYELKKEETDVSHYIMHHKIITVKYSAYV